MKSFVSAQWHGTIRLRKPEEASFQSCNCGNTAAEAFYLRVYHSGCGKTAGLEMSFEHLIYN